MELYYAVSGSGAVLHTLNPRLHPDQVVWIADHAEDQVLFFDLTFLPLVEAIAARVKTIKAFVAMTDRAHMPAPSKMPNLLCYEDLLDGARRPTSTGRASTRTPPARCATPRAPPATRRARCTATARRVLHTYAAALPDCAELLGARRHPAGGADVPRQRLGPAVRRRAWSAPSWSSPARTSTARPCTSCSRAEGVTVSAGVPTVWQGLLTHVEANDLKFSTMRRTIIGGSACPPAMMRAFQERYDVQVLHAWGMTEMSPLGTVCTLKPKHLALSRDERMAVQAKQGRAVFGVDMKIVDDDGQELPCDGKA